MKLPGKNIAPWAREIVDLCTPSRLERIQRGAVYRNVYLTGDDGGNPQTYNKTYAYIDNLCSYLYSPVELRFRIEKYSGETLVDRAKFRAAAGKLHEHMRSGGLDTAITEAVNWALIKGKTFIKLGWEKDSFAPRVIQPEFMGVLEENLDTLDEQEAFVQTTYVTPTKFQSLIAGRPNAGEIMTRVMKHVGARKDQGPIENNMLRQVVVGGLNPYRQAGAQGSGSRGVVNWMTGPNPTFAPQVMANFVAIDELWVKDSDRDGEWTTIQIVGDDCLISSPTQHRNAFADAVDPKNKVRRPYPAEDNPLAHHHPYVEFCATRLEGYFWGLSEIHLIGLLQTALNQRITGIQMMLRLQEKPPHFFSGTSGINQQILSRLQNPGGYLADHNPNAKVQALAPEIPKDIWESLHELEQMFDQIGGFAPVLQGRGESGVRAQGHAETLVRTASPRFKDRALAIERQVEELGGLALDVLRAQVERPMIAWVPGNVQSIETMIPPTTVDEPPLEGAKGVEFRFSDLPECKVTVDAHSSSPAFSHEARELAFALAARGAVSAEELIALTHPPHEQSLINDAERREQQKAQLIAQHPELLMHPGGGGGRKRQQGGA